MKKRVSPPAPVYYRIEDAIVDLRRMLPQYYEQDTPEPTIAMISVLAVYSAKKVLIDTILPNPPLKVEAVFHTVEELAKSKGFDSVTALRGHLDSTTKFMKASTLARVLNEGKNS